LVVTRQHGVVTEVFKHATASVFLFTPATTGDWRLGLVRHPRLHRSMIPGGHVEPFENPAEAALREVSEETGLTARLVAPPGFVEPDGTGRVVPLPWWIVEQDVPAEPRHPHRHVHVDHLYVALARSGQPTAPAELSFGWYSADALDGLDMFADSRACAGALFDRIADLVSAPR
jgi:8-oxo-dGTP pyrophosphatase MutT (NUDIX family)